MENYFCPLKSSGDLGLVTEVGGNVGGLAFAERGAEGPLLFFALERDGGGQVGHAHPPLAGAEQHRHQVPRREAAPARHHAPPPAGSRRRRRRLHRFCRRRRRRIRGG
uniref:Uncharacterized protein n=1 Tax=Arundo donax TaxID=35708 RepID=A0A0A9ECR9_ARUDO